MSEECDGSVPTQQDPDSADNGNVNHHDTENHHGNGQHLDENESTKLIVLQLSFTSLEETVHDYFSKYGEIEKLDLKRYPDGNSRGFAFIVYKSVESLKREATELISEAPTWARTCCREEQVATMAFSAAMNKCANKFSPFSVTGDPLSMGSLEDQQSVWQNQESSVSHLTINCFDDQTLGLRPSLQQERAALKSRQKGRATTVAVQS